MDKFDLRKYVANRTLTTTPKKVRRISEAKNSIHKKLSEIENLGRAAALEIKMEAIAEEIEKRNTRLGMIDENEDLAELIDEEEEIKTRAKRHGFKIIKTNWEAEKNPYYYIETIINDSNDIYVDESRYVFKVKLKYTK